MINPLPDPPLLVITDRDSAAGPVEDIVAAALAAGCRWIMWRDKSADPAARDIGARKTLALCRAASAVFIVNGDLNLAGELGADGVHLQSAEDVRAARAVLGDPALIGVSCHSLDDIEAAGAAGADYATLSPIFLTDSKPAYGPALELGTLAMACRTASLPVLALAGINEQTVGSCMAAGASGVAVMGGVMRAADPRSVVSGLIAAF